MKFIRLIFCHPIKGHASLTQLLIENPQSYRVKIDSKDSNLIKIPINKCQHGKWKVVLDWEYDNEIFVHQKEFEI